MSHLPLSPSARCIPPYLVPRRFQFLPLDALDSRRVCESGVFAQFNAIQAFFSVGGCLNARVGGSVQVVDTLSLLLHESV